MNIKIKDFSLTDTFECGQCFRWNKKENGIYTGIAGGEIFEITQKGDFFTLPDSEFLKNYLDLNTDYSQIKEKITVDSVMEKAISCGQGIRLLNQEFFETVISFIISQNNNIPRIKGIVESFCRTFGRKIEGDFYAFPDAESLKGITPKDLEFLRAGYRTSYICDAVEQISENKIDYSILKNAPIEEARREISKIKGVGPKVADCILLFSVKRGEVFPTDVWMKRVLTELYGFNNLTPDKINAFAKEKFGEYAGYAQQYLFYSMRNFK
ncbi:MAG: DNA glycosylase [Clostridia bacterium]|nr:DNA glycosylase [Clostridia bacterium]